MSEERGLRRKWTDEMISVLKEQWAARPQLSARQIGAGLGVPRSAVIGKAHRLKLPAHDKNPAGVSRPSRPARPRLVAAIVCRPVSFMELSEITCRWPLGEPGPGLMFCGSQPESDRPYCAGHCRMAYQPQREPKTSFIPRRRAA